MIPRRSARLCRPTAIAQNRLFQNPLFQREYEFRGLMSTIPLHHRSDVYHSTALSTPCLPFHYIIDLTCLTSLHHSRDVYHSTTCPKSSQWFALSLYHSLMSSMPRYVHQTVAIITDCSMVRTKSTAGVGGFDVSDVNEIRRTIFRSLVEADEQTCHRRRVIWAYI